MGIVCGLLSALFSAAKDLLSKRLAFRIDGMTSTFASFAFALPFYAVVWGCLYLAGVEKITLTTSFLVLVLLRSITDVLGEGLKMYAFAHADISVVVNFFSLSPLLLLIASPLITGDALSWQAVLATTLVVIGSFLLVYRPSDKSWAEQRKGIILALCASLFFTFNSCFDRLAVQQGTPVFAGFSMTFITALFVLPFVAFRRDRMDAMWRHQYGLWIRGALEVAFMSAKLMALQYLDAPQVVSLQRLSLVLSIIGGRVFFHERDFARRLAAGLLLFVSVLVILSWNDLVHWWYAISISQ